MDFVWGASLAPGGCSVIALPATAKGGTVSRIVPTIAPGAGVVTTRGHVGRVATEHGIVDLAGQSLRRRAELLIAIADPAARPDLRAAAVRRRFFLQQETASDHRPTPQVTSSSADHAAPT